MLTICYVLYIVDVDYALGVTINTDYVAMLVQETGYSVVQIDQVCYASEDRGDWAVASTDLQDDVLRAQEEALGVLLCQLVHLVQGSVASQLGSTARQAHCVLPDLPCCADQHHSDEQKSHDVARVAASGVASEAQPMERQGDGQQHVRDGARAYDRQAEQEAAYEPLDEPGGLPGRAGVQGPRFAPGAVEDRLVEQAVVDEETDGRADEVLDDLEGVVEAVDVDHRVCVLGQERRRDEGAAEDQDGEED